MPMNGVQSNDEIKKEDEPSDSQNEPAGIIPKPNRELFDPSLPIYKKGDSTQAGELGKSVKIEKTVSGKLFFSMFNLDSFFLFCCNWPSLLLLETLSWRAT